MFVLTVSLIQVCTLCLLLTIFWRWLSCCAVAVCDTLALVQPSRHRLKRHTGEIQRRSDAAVKNWDGQPAVCCAETKPRNLFRVDIC